MAFARRVLVVLIAAAVALAPVGVATAGHAPQAKNPAHQTHALPHDHAAMQMSAASHTSAKHCEDKTAPSCCCDDEGTCAQTCLQNCFGQTAVIPSSRALRILATHQFHTRPADRPPGWSSAPQLPPPRA